MGQGRAPSPEALAASPEPLLLPDTEAAALLGISRAHLHRLRAAGKFIESIRLGRKLLFDREELVAWKDARCPALANWRAMRAQSRRRAVS
jgi:excisionase family DNA binding protein